MEIVSIQISGFKNYAVNTQFYFKDTFNNFIFHAENEQKVFIFKTILGILFGFNKEEQDAFRGSREESKVFTGIITFDLEDRTLLIERDFETNIVAGLIVNGTKSKPVFQGKDFIDQGMERPYIQMISTMFPVTDKDIISDICLQSYDFESGNFSDLLEIFYTLLQPSIQNASLDRLIKSGNKLIKQIQSAPPEGDTDNKQKVMELLVNIDRSVEVVESQKSILTSLRERINKKNEIIFSQSLADSEENSAEKYMNPLVFKEDVLHWRELRAIKLKSEAKLERIRSRFSKLQKIIKEDLFIYQNLPKTFEEDLSEYKKINSKLTIEKNNETQYKQKLQEIEKNLQELKKKKRFYLFLMPPIIFIISLLLVGPFWLLIIPETLFLAIIILLYFGHKRYTLNSHHQQLSEEEHIVKRKINKLELMLKELSQNSLLIEDIEYIDDHRQRYLTYKEYKAELENNEKEKIHLIDVLNSDECTNMLPKYIQKYSPFIDIERIDLEDFLDEIVSKVERLTIMKPGVELPIFKTISKLIKRYDDRIKKIKMTKSDLTESLYILNRDENTQDAAYQKSPDVEVRPHF